MDMTQKRLKWPTKKDQDFQLPQFLIFFFVKILGICPLVLYNKVCQNWCQGHQYGSTYKVIRLSDVHPTAWRPNRFSHIDALHINLSHSAKESSLNFSRKKIRIGGVENLSFFSRQLTILNLNNSHIPNWKKNEFNLL